MSGSTRIARRISIANDEDLLAVKSNLPASDKVQLTVNDQRSDDEHDRDPKLSYDQYTPQQTSL